jgi:hypothetical protein
MSKNLKAKLNPDVKKDWLKSLRSGKYKQGKNALCNAKEQFCCLGVLCDIHRIKVLKKGKGVWEKYSENSMRYDDETGVLPKCVIDWAFRKNGAPNPSVKIKGGKSSLATANDEGTSFAKIADIIEEQL